MMDIGHLKTDGYEGVYFQDEEGNTLGIERLAEFSAQDVEDGMDTYCLVLGSGQCSYGGLESWDVVAPGKAVLVLTEAGAEALGTGFDAFEIEADPAQLVSIDHVIQRLIAS